jgi:hypothetical protein
MNGVARTRVCVCVCVCVWKNLFFKVKSSLKVIEDWDLVFSV